MIVDYKGRIVGQHLYGAGSSYVAGTIDIDALRNFRAHAQWDNWMKDLRTELYQLVYEQPIYPKNLYLDRAPFTHAEFREQVIEKQIRADARARGLGRSGLIRTDPDRRRAETADSPWRNGRLTVLKPPTHRGESADSPC